MNGDLRASGLIVTIPVADLGRALAFYRDVLGFDHLRTSEAGALLRAGDGRLLLYPSSAAAPSHTLAGFEVERLEPVIEVLTARGVAFDDYDFPGLERSTTSPGSAPSGPPGSATPRATFCRSASRG